MLPSLQREILEDAVTMLAESGRLVLFDLCLGTEENEEIVKNWFDMILTCCSEHINGMVASDDLQETAQCTLISLRERVSLFVSTV